MEGGKEREGRGKSFFSSERSSLLVAVGDRWKGKMERQERPVRKQG